MSYALYQWREEVDDFLAEIGPALEARAITLLALLSEKGPTMPSHVKALKDGLFELKVDTKGRALRFFYMYWRGRIVVLNCLDKKTQKTPDAVIDMARKRKKQVETDNGSIEQFALN